MTPANSGPPLHRRARRFWRISSFTDRSARSGTPKGERVRAPSVSGYDDTAISECRMKVLLRENERCGIRERKRANSARETDLQQVVIEYRPVTEVGLRLGGRLFRSRSDGCVRAPV